MRPNLPADIADRILDLFALSQALDDDFQMFGWEMHCVVHRGKNALPRECPTCAIAVIRRTKRRTS